MRAESGRGSGYLAWPARDHHVIGLDTFPSLLSATVAEPPTLCGPIRHQHRRTSTGDRRRHPARRFQSDRNRPADLPPREAAPTRLLAADRPLHIQSSPRPLRRRCTASLGQSTQTETPIVGLQDSDVSPSYFAPHQRIAPDWGSLRRAHVVEAPRTLPSER